MTPQRSMWNSWSAADEPIDAGTPAPASQTPMPLPAHAPPSRPAATTRRAPATHALAPPPALANAAIMADLARQARAARTELQAAQEQFARRSLALLEALRLVDANLVELATHVLGNEVIAAAWFSSRNLHLGQRAPFEVLVLGDREVIVTELLRIEHGVY